MHLHVSSLVIFDLGSYALTPTQVWCSVYCLPKAEDSIFIAVFDADSKKKSMQYTALDSRVSLILPVNNTVSGAVYSNYA